MHIPVLQKEVIKYLSPKPNENFIDATFGGGGHAWEILKMNIPNGKVLGIEIDPVLYLKAKEKIEGMMERFILVNDSYINLRKITERYNFRPVNGIVFDLGMSSWHLERSGRGFSFLRDEPLDMRYDIVRNPRRAEEIVNRWPEKEIEKILKNYGEEIFAKRIARQIVKQRQKAPLKTTFELVEVIRRAVPPWYRWRKIHFATKTFQALRIAVNNELDILERALAEAMQILEEGGRLVIISFHSLEDRVVKNFLRKNKNQGYLEIITKKPVSPSLEEIKQNFRSRSAKLRAGVKIKK